MLREMGAEGVHGTHDVVTVMTVALGAAMGLADNSLAAEDECITANTKRMHIAVLGIWEAMSVACVFACTKSKQSVSYNITKMLVLQDVV